MKKFLVIILSFLYMASATGATIHMHYCMDELVEVGWGTKEEKKCTNCGTDQCAGYNKTCCKDEYKQVKTEKDHKFAESVVFSMQAVALTPASYLELPKVLVPSLIEEYPVSHAPPGSGKVRTHLLHCIFLI